LSIEGFCLPKGPSRCPAHCDTLIVNDPGHELRRMIAKEGFTVRIAEPNRKITRLPPGAFNFGTLSTRLVPPEL
jgi:hypothetical protein